MFPSYLKICESEEIEKRIEKLKDVLKDCVLCPHQCHVNRLAGEKGKCRGGANARISSAAPHFGEESPLVGRFGSGTIFLSQCNLGCLFCQNYDISHYDSGIDVSAEEISYHMLALQKAGCHNINFVTPTHYIPEIVEAIMIACRRGLKIPIVYNCGGYENVEILELLDGIIDIYMPDAKFYDDKIAAKYTNAKDYSKHMKESLIEMHRQVGDLKINKDGIAERGLLVRHLVMPGMMEDSKRILKFISDKISSDTYVNVMGQYRPCHRANEFAEINRYPKRSEIEEVKRYAEKFGLKRGL
ncbi:MAG: radical SAM protein [Candidatus Schekmanbacteria bacterium]|nr:MAG: radical SAM protein [Candidatus Schekmanbacteria bacterium]